MREKQKREREAQVLKQRREERRGAATVAATAAKLKRRTDEDVNITKDKVKTSRIVARALTL